MITGYIYMIYKEGLKEIYIGSTEDLEDRKDQHKYRCECDDIAYSNMKVYKFIRENGGWNEWVFEMIEQYECENRRELEQREQYYMDINKDNLLNTHPAYTSKEDRKKRQALRDKEKHKRNWNDEEKREQLKEKNRLYQKTSQYNLTEKRKEYVRNYRIKNREKMNIYKREYRKREKEKNICIV